MDFRIDTRSVGNGTVVIDVTGELDIHTSSQLKQAIVDVLNRGVARLVINLKEVEYLDSTTLGVLLGALRRMREAGGELRIVCDNPRHLRIFDLTALTRVFDIYPSEPAALEG